MKEYLVEFTLGDGSKEQVTLTTDNIKWSIEQWSRNRFVTDHQILEEGHSNTKGMLLG